MLHATRGIVFRQIKYTDNSMIVTIYTEVFGLQSYLVRGIRSKKSGSKAALLMPMSMVDMVVYHKEKNELQYIKEITANNPFHSIRNDIIKSSVVLFLSEILNKSIKEVEANQALFEFLDNSIHLFDNLEEGKAIFHFVFLLQLTKHLGFFPNKPISRSIKNFNLLDGGFNITATEEQFYIKPPYSDYIFQLVNSNYENLTAINIPQNHRSELLDIILKYFEVHLSGFSGIKSHKVLKQILND